MSTNHDFKANRAVKSTMTIIVFFICSITMLAQPSGGPYGPVPQIYQIPKVAGKIYYVAPNGNSDATGTSLSDPTTIESAFDKARSGDAIILRGGIYRTGNLLLNQGITMQPYADEQPVLKGTYVAENWTDLGNNLWVTKWEHLFPMPPESWWRRHRFGPTTPLHRFDNDMVFADGRFLQSVGWEGDVDENTFYVDQVNKEVYIGVDPTKHTIEITAFNVAIHRVDGELRGIPSDGKGPVIRGITFTQYAYRAFEFDGTNPEWVSPEKEHGKRVTGTTLEHVTISYCSRVGGYFRGDNLTIRNCKVSDTSTEGVFILSSSDVLLERNIFTRNNIENITGYYPAAVKIFNQCYRVTCNDNLVIDLPNSNGIWYDVGNVDGVFTNNWVENVGNIKRQFDKTQPWPSDNGFFFEISKNAIVAGNVFVNCDQGIFVLNSSGVEIYQNTLINSTVTIARTPRSAVGDHFGWHPASGPDVDKRYNHVLVNNLLTSDYRYNRPLLYVWQTPSLCKDLTQPQLKQMNNNVYVQNPNSSAPLILWSPVQNEECHLYLNNLTELRNLHPQFESAGVGYQYGQIPLFRGKYTGSYELLPGFPGNRSASRLPANISNILKLSSKQKPYVGAYPVK